MTETQQSQGRFGQAPEKYTSRSLACRFSLSVLHARMRLTRYWEAFASQNQERDYLGWVYTRIYSHDVAPILDFPPVGFWKRLAMSGSEKCSHHIYIYILSRFTKKGIDKGRLRCTTVSDIEGSRDPWSIFYVCPYFRGPESGDNRPQHWCKPVSCRCTPCVSRKQNLSRTIRTNLLFTRAFAGWFGIGA